MTTTTKISAGHNAGSPRATLVKAMKWWRSQHPEYNRVRVIRHGWHGHAVFGELFHEDGCLATVHEVLTEYAAAMKCQSGDCPDAHTCRHRI
jgi:hypothetical protein